MFRSFAAGRAVETSSRSETLEGVRKHGADGFLVQADVSRVDDVRRMFGDVNQRFGALDVFVANARPEAAKFYQKPMEITPWTRRPRRFSSAPARRLV